uniref:Uncharacterized protein n=1 Tax=Setaria italica TaxID=4555 RepID=K3Y3Y0_SETIT
MGLSPKPDDMVYSAWWLKISGMVDIPLKPRLNSLVVLGASVFSSS